MPHKDWNKTHTLPAANKKEQTWENETIPNSEVLQEFPEEYLEKKMPSLNFEPAVFD